MKPNIGIPHDVTRPAGRPMAIVGRSGTRRRRLRARREDLDPWRTAAPSVWACADASAPSAGPWLDTVVGKTVGRYSAPGDRVLLVAPPAGASVTSDQRAASFRRPWRRYDTLGESAWTVARLGRSVQTTTADSIDSQEQQSPAAGSSSTGESFGLVVVAFDPDGPDHFEPGLWAPVLDSRGKLAVITHSHHLHGKWVDPGPALLAAGRRAGLAYLDHVILLQVPLSAVAGTTTVPDRGVDESPHAAVATVHADLFVFTETMSVARSAQ